MSRPTDELGVELPRIERPGPTPDLLDKHIAPCGCGLWRTLPSGLRVGDVFKMVPCPRCGTAPTLRYHGAAVEQVPPDTPLTLVERRS